jgi:hypothetical protein
MIIPVYGQVLDSAWPWISANLERYPLPYTEQQIYDMCKTGHITVWAVIKEAPIAVVMLCKEADDRAHIVYASGDRLGEWEREVLEGADEWAARNGCHSVCVEGRKGWAKRLAPYGYKREADQWVKRLKSRP